MPTLERIRAHQLKELRLEWVFFVGLLLIVAALVAGLATLL